MNESNEFTRLLNRKRKGGVRLEAFVSREIWLGGRREARAHEPFVAIGPESWDDEEELSFFASRAELDEFIEQLNEAGRAAFRSRGD